MRAVGIKMSILMGITLSFFLSLTGLISSGSFNVPAFIQSFLISLAVSMIIGFLVPMGKVTMGICKKYGLSQGSIKERLISSLISNVIYTPIITFVMITLAYRSATAHGARLNYIPMLIKGEIISFVVGYILIFIFMPLFMKLLLKNKVNK